MYTNKLEGILSLISAGERAEEIRSEPPAVVCRKYESSRGQSEIHTNNFCPEDGSSMFFRTSGVTRSVLLLLLCSVQLYRYQISVPSWQVTGHIIPLPLPLSGFLQATVLYAAPPLVLFLASHPGVLPKYLQSLRYVVCGAAPLGGLDAERFLKRAPPSTEILQGRVQSLLYKHKHRYLLPVGLSY